MDNFKEEIEVYEFTDRNGKTEKYELIDADRFGGMNYYLFVPYIDEDDDKNYVNSGDETDDALFVMKFCRGDFFPVSGNEYYTICELFLKKFDNILFF
jgi:hypothetical protein